MNARREDSFATIFRMSYVIVGLGNPGEEYVHSRHNAGRLAVSVFAGSLPWKENKKAKARVSTALVDGKKATLLLPDTFMNKSGSALLSYVKNLKQAQQLVVVYDDLDLPLGKIKISFGRGSGGHKGVESVQRALKTKDFVRIRIGVSKSTKKGVAKKVQGEDEVVGFVLGTFRKSEMEELQKVFTMVNEALRTIVTEGHEVAMNRFN